jgi:hypothetical protein
MQEFRCILLSKPGFIVIKCYNFNMRLGFTKINTCKSFSPRVTLFGNCSHARYFTPFVAYLIGFSVVINNDKLSSLFACNTCTHFPYHVLRCTCMLCMLPTSIGVAVLTTSYKAVVKNSSVTERMVKGVDTTTIQLAGIVAMISLLQSVRC